jgi:hypothetical protein
LVAPVGTILTAQQRAALAAPVTMLLDPACIAKWRADPQLPATSC